MIFNSFFAERARGIRLMATDIDGVWTDGAMYYGEDGELQKRFSTYDGMAVRLLHEDAIETAVFTGEDSPAVHARMKKLGVRAYFPGETDKLSRIHEICRERGISVHQVAYIGDDLNDLELLPRVGLSAMPPNSPILDRFMPHYITRRPGGSGAFRDFAQMILAAREGRQG
ncbi:MAG: KdsC family phosphatase [Fibrobacterota bacterium]